MLRVRVGCEAGSFSHLNGGSAFRISVTPSKKLCKQQLVRTFHRFCLLCSAAIGSVTDTTHLLWADTPIAELHISTSGLADFSTRRPRHRFVAALCFRARQSCTLCSSMCARNSRGYHREARRQRKFGRVFRVSEIVGGWCVGGLLALDERPCARARLLILIEYYKP